MSDVLSICPWINFHKTRQDSIPDLSIKVFAGIFRKTTQDIIPDLSLKYSPDSFLEAGLTSILDSIKFFSGQFSRNLDSIKFFSGQFSRNLDCPEYLTLSKYSLDSFLESWIDQYTCLYQDLFWAVF